jgi:hypothetical protein
MRIRNHLFLLIALTFCAKGVSAQSIGISSAGSPPEASALLDIDGIDKGLLIPRVSLTSTSSASPITAPANSLLVYNLATAGDVSPGYYYWNGTTSLWVPFETKWEGRFSSVDASAIATTSSTVDGLITGMTLTPGAGTYSVNFNGQCDIPDAVVTTGMNTADLCTDLGLIYDDINAISGTGTHPLIFADGETLLPGVYTVAGAGSIVGALTLDGNGLTNPLFIIKCAGAFNTTAGAVVTLVNGATSENIFWVAQDAIGLGATTTIQGTIISNTAAVAAGSNCTITGRMFTKLGAVTFGPGTISKPATVSSHVNCRGLDSFVLYTCSGGVGNTTSSTYNGDIATGSGAITGFTTAGTVVNGTIYQAGSTASVASVYHEATFSLYHNGSIIPNSDRTVLNSSVISLQSAVTVLAGEAIEVRWKIDSQASDDGQVNISNRILSVNKVD